MADPYYPYVTLLCHFDGTSGQTTFTDNSPINHTLTASAATVSTTAPKFGTGAGDFTNSLSANIAVGGAASDFNLGAGEFTVEAWVYCTAAPGTGFYGVLAQYYFNNGYGWFLGWDNGLCFEYSLNGTISSGWIKTTGSYTPPLNTWIHIAADRDVNGVLRVYANGVVIGSSTAKATIYAATTPASISYAGNSGHILLIDEARVTKGVARYAGSFTPPTAAFDNSQNGQFATPFAGVLQFTGFAPAPTVTAKVSGLVREVLYAGTQIAHVRAVVREVLYSPLMAPAAAAVGVTGSLPTPTTSFAPDSGAIQLGGFAPAPGFAALIPPGALGVSGFAPTLTYAWPVASGHVQLTGYGPAYVRLSLNGTWVMTVSAS